MSGSFVYAHDSLFARRCRKAEELSELGIEPGVLEVHALVTLDTKEADLGSPKLLFGRIHESAVDVDVRCHGSLLMSGFALTGPSLQERESTVIGRMPDK